MDSIRHCTIVFLIALATAPAFAADLVTVSASVSYPTTNPGGHPLGTATSVANVAANSGSLQEQETQSATFEVVAP